MAVSVVATLGFTAACGGGDDEKDTEGKPTGATATKAADEGKGGSEGGGGGATSGGGPAPLTEAQLEKAAIVSGDIKNYKVAKTPEGDIPAETVPAEPAACQSVADMFFFTSTPRAELRTARTLTATSDLNATVVSLALLAHDEQSDAEKVMAGLRTASKSCTAFEHTDYKYSGVKALPDPKQGDEAVSYQMKGSIEGTDVPMTFTIVRSGPTLAAFYAMNVLDADKAQVPADVIEAQLTKLAELEKAAG
ncbi:hypothetical protein [Streptomyces spongiae]|uniref:hypothetical protein n=1 Tax=Streptomyces spongiae TaxID=565072 RepID=UPI002AD43612|nr:hypothetical protein [Streptomyces spongiae]